jgi:hypothetical protein
MILRLLVTQAFPVKGRGKCPNNTVFTCGVWLPVVHSLRQDECSVLKTSTLAPSTIVGHRTLLIIVSVVVNIIVFTQTHFNLNEYKRIFVTMDAVVRFMFQFLYLYLLLSHLLLIMFLVFFLCHLYMLVATVTLILRIMFVLGTVLLLLLLLQSVLSLFFPPRL